MKMKRTLFGGTFATVLISATLPAFAQDPTARDRDLGAAVRQCAIFKNDGDRHACVDDAMIAAGLMQVPSTADQSERFGLPPANENRIAPESGPETGGSYTPRFAQPERVDRIEITLRTVVDRGDGKLILTGENGMVWRQVENEAIRPIPRRGQTMVVERAALGSYTCKIGKWTTFRCIRPQSGG